jgi:hypothetical protein
MKKLFLLFSLILTIAGTAQITVTPMTGNGDTLTNAGADYVQYSPSISYEQISFQPVVTKISGTIGGSAYLSWSNDGTNFINLDTLSLSDVATNTTVFPKTYNPALWYRITFTGTGTMVGKIYGYMLTNGGRGARAMSPMVSSFNLSSDTITNAGSGYVGLTVTQTYNRISIQAVVTKISGTVAGTVTVQGSVDGTNYVTVNSSYITSTTHTATNVATSTKMFVITGSPYKYYRLSYTGSGTMSATLKGFLLPNK